LLPCSKSNLSVSNSTAPVSFSPLETLVTESKQGRERDPITIRVCVCVCVKVPVVS